MKTSWNGELCWFVWPLPAYVDGGHVFGGDVCIHDAHVGSGKHDLVSWPLQC